MTKTVLLAQPIHKAGSQILHDRDDVEVIQLDGTDPAALSAALARAHGVVLRTTPLPAAAIAEAPNLEVVARHGVGYDAVDVDALTARGLGDGHILDECDGPVRGAARGLALAHSASSRSAGCTCVPSCVERARSRADALLARVLLKSCKSDRPSIGEPTKKKSVGRSRGETWSGGRGEGRKRGGRRE